jgi:DNA polymerase-3 subunit chi
VTKVDFYTGSEDKLRTACQISQKAMQNGVRVLLHTPDQAIAEQLNQLLWSFSASAFLPHCFSYETEAATMPIVIGCDDKWPHSELLISLHASCPTFFSRFERVIEIISTDANDAALGRERFKFYRDRGYEIRHIPLTQSPTP